ncbi:PocR ligand-binding domain-containing protein [Hominifimenecus sp. rT4P-3]|uniref:PocR ligand-binding domain-containing protein n=1 Tax=Hominifimenecus sp. rT4P-3 TaxID=3242979 RepID=UPI003DA27CC8
MLAEFFNLHRILRLENWQQLQDAIAKATKMAIITVDYKGIPITEHSCRQRFCEKLRNDPALFPYCHKCDARGGLEAVRQDAPYIYHCHYNIVDVAIPISIHEKYLGAVMIGQVQLPPGDSTRLEKILTVKNEYHAKKWKELEKDYQAIPILPYRDIEAISQMVYYLLKYIVEDAISKNLILETYQNAFPKDTSFAPDLYSAKELEDTKKALANTLLNNRIQAIAQDVIPCHNPVLKPLFEYINNHKSEKLPLSQAASICNVSPSHFSRIFTKETGEHYSIYMSKLKINWSKYLLLETDMPIMQIAEELGFNEPGYFIKTFKKFEGVSPSVFRKHCI